MNKTRNIRTVFAVILSFILAVCLVLCSALFIMKTTAFSSSYAKDRLEKCNFAEEKSKELKTELVSYGNACNISGEFFDEFFEKTLTNEYILNDVVKYYDAVYNSPKATIDTSDLQTKLNQALHVYASENGYDEEETLDDDINLIAKELCEIYTSVISLPSDNTIHMLIARFSKLLNYALIGVAGFTLVDAAVLFFIFKEKRHFVRYLVCSLAAACLMLVALPLYARFTNVIGKINIVSKALYSFVVSFGNGVLNAVLVCSAVFAVLTAIFSAVYIVLSKKNKDGEPENEAAKE